MYRTDRSSASSGRIVVRPSFISKSCVVNQVTVLDEVAVGIYVASFNTRRFTERCVRSILDHTGPARLLTVGDSGSNDGSRQMLQSYADRGKLRLQVSRKPRDHAWWLDKWLRECRHEYAVFLDSDVEIRRDGWLSRMLERAEGASIVCAEFVRERVAA